MAKTTRSPSKGKTGRKRGTAAGDTPGSTPDPTPKASTLAALEAASETDAAVDPDAALDKLTAAAPEPDQEEPPKRRGPGRPKGSKTRNRSSDGTRRRRGKTKSELQAENDELRAKVDALGPDPAETEAKLARGMAGTVSLVGEMLAESGAPAWRFTDDQANALGQIWAPILAPYMATIGAAAPITIAVVQTAVVLLPNYRAHREASQDDSKGLPAGETTAEVVDEGGSGA